MGYVLGIDLGTTYTAAAVFRDGRAEMCSLGTHGAKAGTAIGQALVGAAFHNGN